MSIRAVLSCNGMEGAFPCRQAAPVGEVETAAEARRIVQRVHGWTSVVDFVGLTGTVVHDLCPACTKRFLEHR